MEDGYGYGHGHRHDCASGLVHCVLLPGVHRGGRRGSGGDGGSGGGRGGGGGGGIGIALPHNIVAQVRLPCELWLAGCVCICARLICGLIL